MLFTVVVHEEILVLFSYSSYVVTPQLAVTSEISHVYMVLMHDTYEYTVSEVDITIEG
jgi:hypothetical protein